MERLDFLHPTEDDWVNAYVWSGMVIPHGTAWWVAVCHFCWDWCSTTVIDPSFGNVASAQDLVAGLNLEALAEHIEACRPDFRDPTALDEWLAS